MSLNIPRLHTKSFHQIAAEATRWIAGYSKEWTNRNPSGPGITLLELFSWLADTLYYQLDHIPLETYRYYLRMVTGYKFADLNDAIELNRGVDPNLTSILEYQKEVETAFREKRFLAGDLPELKKRIEEFMNSRYRAVTPHDYETLALEATAHAAAGTRERVARAFVEETPLADSSLNRVQLHLLPEYSFEYQKSFLAPGALSPALYEGTLPVPEADSELVISPGDICKSAYIFTAVPDTTDYGALLATVVDYLKPRRLLGAPLDVSIAGFSDLEISATVVFASISETKTAVWNVLQSLAGFLDPISGGPQKEGWPWGRPVTVSELSKLIEETPGVSFVKSVELKDTAGNAAAYLEPHVLPRLAKAVIRAEGLHVQ